jgi:hypothetical protein
MPQPAIPPIEQVLNGLRDSRCPQLDLGGMYSRNPTAHKWIAPYRSWELRESVYWRTHDLLTQSYALHQMGHGLGARILLRSAFETLAMLIYLNQRMGKVLTGTLDYLAFSKNTEQLLLGSRDGSTPVTAVNILTVLDNCDKDYAGIRKLYDLLSESAHPNYEGMSAGYTKMDRKADIVYFTDRWLEKHGASHVDLMMECVGIFNDEYDRVWPDVFAKLETWIEANDDMLEAAKTAAEFR